MFKSLIVLIFSAVALLGWARPALAADYSVGSAGQGAYVISGLNSPTGQNNPTLSLTRGRTYTFDVTVSGHPFLIKTVLESGSDNTFDTGVTNNGASPGLVTFTVPASAPAQLYYQCQFHEPMAGVLNIVSAPTSSVPALPPSAFFVLGAALLLLGSCALLNRFRRRAA